MSLLMEDRYQDPQSPGDVVGSTSSNGVLRQGVDLEGKLSIDNGALRIQRTLNPGWGRSGVLYGPFQRQNGLALIVHILNGHNASQAGHIIDSFSGRLKQWLRGNYIDGRLNRSIRWFLAGRKNAFLDQLRYWYKNSKGNYESEYLKANLALGWFPSQLVNNPFDAGNLFFICPTGSENGEVQVRASNRLQSTVRSLQNIPVYFMVVLREIGATYYAATFEGVSTLKAYPKFQPLAIDPFTEGDSVHGGFFQSVLGEIGFRVDTRVYATKIALVEEFGKWYGSAHAADKLVGKGKLEEHSAEIGGKWTTHNGRLLRSETGVFSALPNALATLSPSSPSGLIHALVTISPESSGKIGLIWRFKDSRNYFIALIGNDSFKIQSIVNGKVEDLQFSNNHRLLTGIVNSIQIVDQGCFFQLFLNGAGVLDNSTSSNLLSLEKGVGVFFESPSESLFIKSFEAHPREIQVPAIMELNTLQVNEGKKIAIIDDFQGKSGLLENSLTKVGEKTWKKVLGKGNFILRDGKCLVEASIERPNPGRTAYTVEWDYPRFADLTVSITPPGVRRGERERGRGGVIFYQDSNNYIIVSTWLDDNMNGASISSFFKIDGFEDIYDAVWTNVGNRVSFGIPYQLRVTFDGLSYTALVNNEPVLFRSLTDVYPSVKRLKVHQVGIVANWEWGDDTGSVYHNFIAKARDKIEN